jgi:hypothetical protein
MKVLTSDQVLRAEDLYSLQDKFLSSHIPFGYVLTEGEKGWLSHIRGKYSIADWVDQRMDGNGILTFDCPFSLSEALEDDGISCKAVMLDDKTALQKLFFWLND